MINVYSLICWNKKVFKIYLIKKEIYNKNNNDNKKKIIIMNHLL